MEFFQFKSRIVALQNRGYRAIGFVYSTLRHQYQNFQVFTEILLRNCPKTKIDTDISQEFAEGHLKSFQASNASSKI